MLNPEQFARTAYDLKDAHRMLEGLTDDALKQIPVQGAAYIDLKDPHRTECTATGDMVADEAHWYVPKSAVDYELWNRLSGIDNPERLYPVADPAHAKSREV